MVRFFLLTLVAKGLLLRDLRLEADPDRLRERLLATEDVREAEREERDPEELREPERERVRERDRLATDPEAPDCLETERERDRE